MVNDIDDVTCGPTPADRAGSNKSAGTVKFTGCMAHSAGARALLRIALVDVVIVDKIAEVTRLECLQTNAQHERWCLYAPKGWLQNCARWCSMRTRSS